MALNNNRIVYHTQETDGGRRSCLALHVQDLRVAVNQRSKGCGEQDSGERRHFDGS